jgi:hypothetical protein
VTAVYPSASQLPSNLLKLYLYFSAPMRAGDSYRHIRLEDDAGNPVEAPFLPLQPELWDREQRRLTLWFDPGRIKQGLIPNRTMGPPLEEGRRYRLIVDTSWRDANGRPLAEPFVKRFTTTAADDDRPDPAGWIIEAPRASTRQALVVALPEPMDFAMLRRSLVITDATGAVLAGEVSVDAEETIWRFTPSSSWRPGTYRLLVRADLEDLAGNNLRRLFDTDLDAPSRLREKEPVSERSFVVEASE